MVFYKNGKKLNNNVFKYVNMIDFDKCCQLFYDVMIDILLIIL